MNFILWSESSPLNCHLQCNSWSKSVLNPARDFSALSRRSVKLLDFLMGCTSFITAPGVSPHLLSVFICCIYFVCSSEEKQLPQVFTEVLHLKVSKSALMQQCFFLTSFYLFNEKPVIALNEIQLNLVPVVILVPGTGFCRMQKLCVSLQWWKHTCP